MTEIDRNGGLFRVSWVEKLVTSILQPLSCQAKAVSQPSKPNPYQSPEATQKEAATGVAFVSAGSQWTLWATLAGSLLLIACLYWLAAGYAIIAAIVFLPAQLRAVIRLWKEARLAGEWSQPSAQLAVVVSSLLICIPVGIATVIAFFTVCFAGAFAAAATLNPGPGDRYGFNLMARVGIPLGALAAVVVFGYVWWWAVKKRVLWEKELPLPENAKEESEA